MGGFNSFSEFLAMGGYAIYVWSAYAFFVVILVFNIWQPMLARKKYFKLLLRREQVQQERAQAKQKREDMTNDSTS
ncbi:MAG: heme exporter protein CcmD [SAR86 cluster bacterium]|uniref:Heme exporter protein D n=1 Tax=SAR86 cluster bacterium TaxID=2030880 RepID=A0A2A5CC86_9GAMM|nr:heme exporter protein CcmD [Gammaproteobacteria bacterium AH-315-E17]PCJ41449.1 MAG: heme exporter protein CcmD [SAR86 cluster bacterium]